MRRIVGRRALPQPPFRLGNHLRPLHHLPFQAPADPLERCVRGRTPLPTVGGHVLLADHHQVRGPCSSQPPHGLLGGLPRGTVVAHQALPGVLGLPSFPTHLCLERHALPLLDLGDQMTGQCRRTPSSAVHNASVRCPSCAAGVCRRQQRLRSAPAPDRSVPARTSANAPLPTAAGCPCGRAHYRRPGRAFPLPAGGRYTLRSPGRKRDRQQCRPGSASTAAAPSGHRSSQPLRLASGWGAWLAKRWR